MAVDGLAMIESDGVLVNFTRVLLILLIGKPPPLINQTSSHQKTSTEMLLRSHKSSHQTSSNLFSIEKWKKFSISKFHNQSFAMTEKIELCV